MSDDFSDDYVAELLKRDAKAKNKEYSFVGLSAFRPSKPSSNAPKANTRFLRNIIRETDSHNAALKEKEVAEARARFRALRKDAGPSQGHSSRALKAERKLYEPPSKRRRLEGQAGGLDANSKEPNGEISGRKHRRSPDRGETQHMDRPRRKSRISNVDGNDSDELEGRQRKQSSHHRSVRRYGNERSASPKAERSSKSHREHKRRRSRSPSDRHKSAIRDHSHRKSHRRRHSRSDEPTKSPRVTDGDDSDPLEAIVGPLRAPQPIKRGRGAHGSSSTMDAHFKDTYDPSTDVQLDTGSSSKNDDWGQAVEEFRDRAKWKALGAERLRSAGFSEAEVSKWESSGREKGEEDVIWAKAGEGREWDRGKVVVGQGDTELKAAWNK